MKKIVLGLLGLFISFVVVSQTKMYILTEDRTECIINVNTGDVTDCGETIKSPGVYIIDDDYSNDIDNDVFTHIVPGMSSIYDVISYKIDGPTLVVENVSDVGNVYVHFFDFENDNVLILFMNQSELIDNTYRRIVSFKISHVHTIN